MVESFQFFVDPIQVSIRLDQFLVQQIPDESRAHISASVQAGLVRVNGKIKKNSYRLKGGERVTGSLSEPPVLDVLPEQIDFEILFEDEHLIVLSKPPHLVVHPGSGNRTGTLVNGLVDHCTAIQTVGDPIRPGIVHRLDKDTSGVMLVAKTPKTHRRLVEAFQAQAVEKQYTALLCGSLREKQGRICANIGRHPVNRKKMAVRRFGGKFAATNWRVVREYRSGYSLATIGIETGRTHQIRVHMGSLGHPVAGDRMYGRKGEKGLFPRQMLHASVVRFAHPLTGDVMVFEAPLWPDFEVILRDL